MARAVSCPRCNKRLPEEAKFCRRCGTGLRGRTAPLAEPPLVSTGYDSPPSAWQGSYAEDASPMLGYQPRGERRTRRPKATPPRAGSPTMRWWLFIILGIFAFRACSSFHRSDRRPDPPTYFHPAPPIRTTPEDYRLPPAQEDGSQRTTPDGRPQETAPDDTGQQSTSP